MQQTVLILGASGKIGSHAAEAFWNAGWKVRLFNRKTDNMTQAAMGANVIVNGMNPAGYKGWATAIPAITAQVIAAAKASGATVIVPGNIYNFGNQPGVLSETTPQTPHTRKGKIRVEMEAAYAASGVQTIVLRAGNFIDPHHNDDIMSMLIMREIAKGKITHGGDPDAMQAYCYLPDWARAAVMLAEMRTTLAQFEDVPFPGHAFTFADLRDVVQSVTATPVKLNAFPWWMMTALSPFWALAYELREMRYLYTMPHHISATKFDRLLPNFAASDLRQVMLAGLPADVHPDEAMRTSSKTIAAE